MKSLNAQIKQIEGLLGTKDINDWEQEFIASVVEKTGRGHDVSHLSEKQITSIERLHNKHYGDH